MDMIWENCYDDSWQGIIVPEAFAHPAKMAYGLLNRILGHAWSEGWIKSGSLICDPFGGIGSTGIMGAYGGYRVICVELEQKFVDLAEQNFELHRKKFQALNCPQPIIIQGDSRKLCEILSKADLIVSSPPYAESPIENTIQSRAGNPKTDITKAAKKAGYGTTPGQLGAMKPGSADAVISSPPFLQGNKVQARSGFGPAWRKVPFEQRMDKCPIKGDYGQTPGNLGNLKPGEVSMVISSPPWENTNKDIKNADSLVEKLYKSKQSGNLETTGMGGDFRKTLKKEFQKSYGDSEGQLGNEQGQTFWQAAKEIVQECHKILKPGGVAIWVVKAFVRKGQIVDFPGDWRRLCESCGFQTLHEHKAMLVKETKHEGLFGTITEKKERKSFFRRLAESKGSPKIDYETVICMRKKCG